MLRRIIITGCIIFFTMNTFAAEKAGYVLLDKLVLTFKGMAEKGSGGYQAVNSALQEMMADAKKAKAQEQIDPIFFSKYHRLLEILKLVIITEPYDPEGILKPLIRREINEFVKYVYGEESHFEDREIGVVAASIAEEILNLRLYLDTQKQRAELKEKYSAWIEGKPKKK